MSKIKEIVTIADSLRKLADDLVALFDAPQEPVQAVQDTPLREPVQDAVPQEPIQPAEKSNSSTMTLEELRAFVSAYSSMENRPKIRAILVKFGVNKLTELPLSQYEALKKEVAAI